MRTLTAISVWSVNDDSYISFIIGKIHKTCYSLLEIQATFVKTDIFETPLEAFEEADYRIICIQKEGA